MSGTGSPDTQSGGREPSISRCLSLLTIYPFVLYGALGRFYDVSVCSYLQWWILLTISSVHRSFIFMSLVFISSTCFESYSHPIQYAAHSLCKYSWSPSISVHMWFDKYSYHYVKPANITTFSVASHFHGLQHCVEKLSGCFSQIWLQLMTSFLVQQGRKQFWGR